MAENVLKMKQNVKFHKDTFDKTTEDRRQRVIEVAVSEFAANGYNAANINEIAKNSGISIGAMYSYFASKEDLFLAVVNRAYSLLETGLKEILARHGDIFDMFEGMLKASREYAIKYPELNQIYLDLTTQALSRMAGRLSNKLETITAQLYRDAFKRAKKEGKIGKDVSEETAAFFIDNLLMMYQFSFSADYYKERMRIFLGEANLADVEGVEKAIMRFIRKALA